MASMVDQGGYEERYYRLRELHESVVLKRYTSARMRDGLKTLLRARILLNEFLVFPLYARTLVLTRC